MPEPFWVYCDTKPWIDPRWATEIRLSAVANGNVEIFFPLRQNDRMIGAVVVRHRTDDDVLTVLHIAATRRAW